MGLAVAAQDQLSTRRALGHPAFILPIACGGVAYRPPGQAVHPVRLPKDGQRCTGRHFCQHITCRFMPVARRSAQIYRFVGGGIDGGRIDVAYLLAQSLLVFGDPNREFAGRLASKGACHNFVFAILLQPMADGNCVAFAGVMF
jgi:hypothetical protein